MIEVSPKFYIGVIVICLTTVSIQLIPISRQANIWNRCFTKTSASLSQVEAFHQIDDQSKDVLSVMICNGAVFEPKLNSNIK